MTRPTVVAFASGKGGVGKSLLAANCSVFLATLGRRVLLVDAAFGAASTHAFVGVRDPRLSLSAVLSGEAGARDVACATAVPGLEMLAGQGDPLSAADPGPAEVDRLLSEIDGADADYVVIDTRAGTSRATLDLVLAADFPVVLFSPEPTAIELSYRLLKSAFLRRIESSVPGALTELAPNLPTALPAPIDVYRASYDSQEDIAEAIVDFSPYIVLNRARSKTDIDLGLTLTRATRRRLGLPARYLGHLEHDDAVGAALRRQRALLIEHPEARVSKCIEKITRRLLSRSDTGPSFEELSREPSYYELLEVEPTAIDEEIRRANRRMRADYSADSMVVNGLYSRPQLELLQDQFDRAYEILMDPLRRKAYDQELFPDGVPESVVPVAQTAPVEVTPPEERPPMPELGPNTEFSGKLMRQVREARGFDLRDISERTKIGMAYLEAIENEIYRKLPATVYVRGFIAEYAKVLGLDQGQVAESYLRRIGAAEKEGPRS